jgi:hypothetical protein
MFANVDMESCMAKVNKSQAARMANVSRTTIDNYIADSKLSAEVDGKKTVIDVSELERVFGKLVAPDAVISEHKSLQTDTSQVAAILQSKIELLERQIYTLLEDKEKDRQERDRLLSIIEKQTLLLPAPKEPTKTFWQRWFT